MKAFVSRALLFFTAAALFISCLPEKEYLYSETGMCTRIGHDRLLTDKGLTYNVVENGSGMGIPDTLTRVMISCDVMSEVAGSSNEYNIRLLDFMAAYVADPVKAGTPEEEEAGHDGIGVAQAWVSGGYFNGYVTIAVPNPVVEEHALNLVFDEARSTSDTLYFEMRHNANGECPENEKYDLYAFQSAGTYVSFPLKGILPESGKKPVVHVEWDWYDNDGVNITREKITRSGNLTVE